MYNLKRVIHLIMVFLPPCELKNHLYRSLFQYKIGKGVRISHSLLDVDYAEIGDGSYIGKLNVIKGISCLIVGSHCRIGHYNKFVVNPNLPWRWSSEMTIGNHVNITNHHYFDLTDSIAIGDDVVIGGEESQFWTHGFDIKRNRIQSPIKIGHHCYLGSRITCNMGVELGEGMMVGASSVITRSFAEGGLFIAGNPAVAKRPSKGFEAGPLITELYRTQDGCAFYRRMPEGSNS